MTNRADVNQDGVVDTNDLTEVIQNLGWTADQQPGSDGTDDMPVPNPANGFDADRWQKLLDSQERDKAIAYVGQFVGPQGKLAKSGRVVTERDGQVIEDLHITGNIVVNHDNVTIRNCLIEVPSNSQFRNSALYAIDDRWPFSENTLIENVRARYAGDPVDGGYTYRGMVTGSTTIRDSVFEDVLWGLEISSETVVERCIIEPGVHPQGWHSASITVKDARKGATVRHCALLHGTTSAVQIWSPHAPVKDLVVESCILDADHANYEYQGGWTPTDGKKWSEMERHSVRHCLIGQSKSGPFHPGEQPPFLEWEGNVWMGAVRD